MNRRTLVLGAGAVALAAVGAGASLARMGSSNDHAAAMSALRAPLPASAELRDIIRYATLAANGHNTQPWRFKLAPHAIRITPDLDRRTPAVDPDDHHMYVSLGCAAENLS